MIQEIGDRIFDNHYRPDIRMRAEDELFLFDEKSGEIGMKESEDGMLEIPKAGEAALTEEECVYLFSIDDTRFFMPKSECSVSLPPCRMATSIGLLGFSERENRKTCALQL